MKTIQTARTRFIAAVVMVAVFLYGCATTSVMYNGGTYNEAVILPNTGTASILLSSAAPQVSVVIDDRILLDARYLQTRRVDVRNIPLGTHTIKVFANSWQLSGPIDYSGTLDVSGSGASPIIIQVPPYSTLYWVYIIACAVVAFLPAVVVYY